MTSDPESFSLISKLPDLASLNPKPTPIGSKCNPLCPYFECSMESLQSIKVNKGGMITRRPHCLMLGGDCLGIQCRHSKCKLLMADGSGRCLLAIASRR